MDLNHLRKWPAGLSRIKLIFSQINPHLTFILSHSRAIITTFEYIEKLIPELTLLDLAIIKFLLPNGDVFFGYVDENQINPDNESSLKSPSKPVSADDVYELLATKNHRLNQLLVFKFDDMKLDSIGALSRRNQKESLFFNHKDLSITKLSHSQLVNMISSRADKFTIGVSKYLSTFSPEISDDDIMNHLYQQAHHLIPEKLDFRDPVDAMNNRKRIKLESLSPDTTPWTADDMINLLKSGPHYNNQIEYEAVFTPQKPQLCIPFDVDLYNIHPYLIHALQHYKGINLHTDLYSHQVEALSSLMGDEKNHVIISTSTSSGKSLVYQIPIINDILWDIETYGTKAPRKSTAFFVFPTKALAQDQKNHLELLIKYIPDDNCRRILVDTYDGDTDSKSKAHIRRYSDIVFTNPDAIHAAILPNHDGFYNDNGWSEFLLVLKYVVMDEIHVYKGSFGVHVSYIMARLARIVTKVRLDEAKLLFVSCSATVLDPASHFKVVCSIPEDDFIVHIDKDGSPCCEKKFLLWNPPPLMNKKGEYLPIDKFFSSLKSQPSPNMVPRVNIMLELARVLLQILAHSSSLKVIVFCPIRKMCEILMKEARNLLKEPEFRDSLIVEGDIMAYRGGYSKEDRRNIEQKMFNGDVRALVATNALELGIDLSDLDVVITCGFPRLKLNLHQQFGRSGRGQRAQGSLAILVVGSGPVEHHYIQNPQELCDKSTYEDLCVGSLIGIDMHRLILENHLQCAAFEHSLDVDSDYKWFSRDNNGKQLFQSLCKEKLNVDNYGKYRSSPEYLPWPPEHVLIRNVEETHYAVVDITNGRNLIIEEIEESRTSFTLYEGGIFLHQGLPYLIKEFNTDGKYAKVIRVDVDWITQQRDFTDVDPIEIEYVRCLKTIENSQGDIPAYFGKIETTIIVFGFFKVNKKGEIIEPVEVKNPPVHFYSKGFWLDIPKSTLDALSEKHLSPAGGIHAAQHTIMNVLPIYISGATTDSNVRYYSDVGESELLTECKAPEKEFARTQTKRIRPGRLIFYDAKGGRSGSGVSAKAFEHINKILLTAFQRIDNCQCQWGCPNCVTASFCKEGLVVMSKPAAYIILGNLIGKSLSDLLQAVPDGPEANLPNITIETVKSSSSAIKMSRSVKVVNEK